MTDDAIILLYQTIMSDVTVICQCFGHSGIVKPISK